jgi:hypothetical protein
MRFRKAGIRRRLDEFIGIAILNRPLKTHRQGDFQKVILVRSWFAKVGINRFLSSRFSLMNQQSVLSQFEMLLPLAATWAIEQEQEILRDGVPLSEKEVGDARALVFKARIGFACYKSKRSRDHLSLY